MTVDEARKRMDEIKDQYSPKGWNDHESLHSMEDDLRADVLRAIANGSPDAVELARIALETDDLDFSRWCA